jgi:hypothetical protein
MPSAKNPFITGLLDNRSRLSGNEREKKKNLWGISVCKSETVLKKCELPDKI